MADRLDAAAGGHFTLRSRRVVTPGAVRSLNVRVENGRIAVLERYEEPARGVPLIDLGDQPILPGFVDTHVHVNEPGRADWEGFETATRAALAGGITSMIEMPLNAIPATTTAESLKLKAESTRGKLSADVGFWGGVVPGNAAELEPLWKAGAFGFKCFLVPSGVDEFHHVTESDLERAMPILTRLGAPLLVHAEVPGPIDDAAELTASVGWEPRRYACYLESRPHAAEVEAIRMMLRLQERFGTRVHIVHLSAADALPLLRAARQAQRDLVSVETCPHYLHFAAEDIADGATLAKCAPPIREAENRERLWRALEDGDIQLVASDHSPCPPIMKARESGDFMSAWGGIASLELGPSIVWTGMRRRRLDLVHLARWMSEAPARLAGLARKGGIEPGKDADLVIFAPDDDFVVDPERLRQRHRLTPYAGARLSGVVEATFLRGRVAFDHGGFTHAAGQVLLANGA